MHWATDTMGLFIRSQYHNNNGDDDSDATNGTMDVNDVVCPANNHCCMEFYQAYFCRRLCPSGINPININLVQCTCIKYIL